ncbi:MAG TPA: LemA family protein [Alphaproteobacteria bacterium]|jgi:LemA protein
MDTSTIVIIVLVVIAGYFILVYNRMVALRQTRNNAFSDIDVQLKQRYSLIPNLVETVKGYASHEKTLLENVTAARAQVGQSEGAGAERMAAESMLGGALGRLLAVAENYPQLKADANFRQLMSELSDIENKIAAARRFFNSATNEFNTAVQQFPANLVAGIFGFHTEPFFEIDEAEKAMVNKTPDVKF